MRAAIGMVDAGFGLGPATTLLGAWWVLRANQAWAPYPDNDPDRARAFMRRFYALVQRVHGLSIDPTEAARLEVAWWHEHRVLQRERTDADEAALVSALAQLYAYVYARPVEQMAAPAHDRAQAMRVSDAWVAGGCLPGDPRLREQRHLLVRSYSRLLDAVAAHEAPSKRSTPGREV
ncbi:MAG: hypothetical protein HY830_16175 [Actinobacteria bacterium]|nr:hypothetical protein [Actinomycetota bacterium]